MRAHWTAEDWADMAYKPLEFMAIDVYLIRRGQAQRRSESCMSTPATPDSGRGQALPEY